MFPGTIGLFRTRMCVYVCSKECERATELKRHSKLQRELANSERTLEKGKKMGAIKTVFFCLQMNVSAHA